MSFIFDFGTTIPTITPAAEAEVVRQLHAAGVPATSPLPEGTTWDCERFQWGETHWWVQDGEDAGRARAFIRREGDTLVAEVHHPWGMGGRPFATVPLRGVVSLPIPPWATAMKEGHLDPDPWVGSLVVTIDEAAGLVEAFVAKLRGGGRQVVVTPPGFLSQFLSPRRKKENWSLRPMNLSRMRIDWVQRSSCSS